MTILNPLSCVLCRTWLACVVVMLAIGMSFAEVSHEPTPRRVFDHDVQEKGVGNARITSIVQDRFGYLWIGTQWGLYRYNGYDFKAFHNVQDDTTSLASNFIFAACEDSANTLWFGTVREGLHKYDPNNEDFSRVESIGKQTISSLTVDHAGIIWMGTDSGYIVLDPHSGTVRVNELVREYGTSLNSTRVRNVIEDHHRGMWLTSDAGLFHVNAARDQLQRIALQKSNAPRCIAVGADGQVFVGLENGAVWQVNPVSLHATPSAIHLPENVSATALCYRKCGELWIGSTAGLFIVRGEEVTRYVHSDSDAGSLNNDEVTCLCEDRSENMWIGTMWGGLDVWRPQSDWFTSLGGWHSEPQTRTHVIMGAHKDGDGTLWFGGLEGLHEWHPREKLHRVYTHDPHDSRSLSNDRVNVVLRDRRGILWVGTGSGLNRYDGNGRFTRFMHDSLDSSSLGWDWINALHEDRAGRMWISTAGAGLNLYDRDAGTFQSFFPDPHKEYRPNRNVMRSIYEDKSGVLWIGSNTEGLVKFDPETHVFKIYSHDPKNRHSLCNNAVRGVVETPSGLLCIITAAGGMSFFDRTSEEFQSYGEPQGLPSNSMGNVLIDNRGFLWITAGRLIRFDPQSKMFRTFPIGDKAHPTAFVDMGGYVDSAGFFYFPSNNGIVTFDPLRIPRDAPVQTVVISGASIQTKPVVLGSARFGSGEIELQPSDNLLTISFAAIEMADPERIRYAYRMDGIADEWISIGDHREVSFSNLSPGNYIFRARAANASGEWGPHEAMLQIRVLPPWYRTWWAYTLCAMCIIVALSAGQRMQVRRVQLREALKRKEAEARQLQEIDRMKSQFLANISHEFRTPLTLILTPLEEMLQRTPLHANDQNRLKLMRRNGRRVLMLVSQILDLSRLEAGQMRVNSTAGDLAAFVRVIGASFHSLGESRDVHFDVEIHPDNIPMMFDTEKFEHILTNLLANAFKFTPAGGAVRLITGINAATASPRATIEVRDTGIGIEDAELPKIFDRFYQVAASSARPYEGAGIGLALVHDLVELVGGTIQVESRIGQGTRFILSFPLVKPDVAVTSQPQHDISHGKPEGAVVGIAISDASSDSVLLDVTADLPLVLIVEDNVDLRGYLHAILGEFFRIILACDGEEGFSRAVETVPDLIISDIMMPKIDGYTLCSQLKQDERTSHVPVILLTARAERESKLTGLQTGADDYLVKPFDSAELRARSVNLIEQRRSLRERFRHQFVLSPAPVSPESTEEKFIRRVREVIELNMSNENFTVEEMATQVAMSRTQLHRKLQALTNRSAGQLINDLRLERAHSLLKAHSGRVSEIAFSVGFASPSYFSKCFKERYGYPPSEMPKD